MAMYSVQCTLYIVHRTLNTIHCSLVTIQTPLAESFMPWSHENTPGTASYLVPRCLRSLRFLYINDLLHNRCLNKSLQNCNSIN